MKLRMLVLLWPLSLGATVASAAEAPPVPDGTIVQLEGDTAYVDLGLKRGVRPGATLQVLRTINAKHPTSGETLVDHFPLGTMTVEQVGRVLSYGRLDKRIATVVKVGDGVALEAARPSPALPQATATPERAGAARAPDPAAAEITQVWRMTVGRRPEERARLLSDYLRAHPASPYAATLRVEIDAFTAAARELSYAEARARAAVDARHVEESEERKQTRLDILGQLPDELYEHDPLAFSIYVRHAEEVAAAFAYVRRPEQMTYQRLVLARDGDGYFHALAPDDWVVPPRLEVFIEVVDRAGAVLTAGTATAPRRITVDRLPTQRDPLERDRSAVRGFFEFVDFNRFRGNDYYLVAEGDFTYRLGTWLWAVRTGFGVLYGRGGKVQDLDATDSSKNLIACDPSKLDSAPTDPAALACGHEVGFNYGYVEAEFHIGRYVGLAARFLGGQTVQGAGVGGELRLRIGQETGTNLLAGGSFLKDIGALGLLQLECNVVRGWPMSAAVIVTNQPAQEDIGVRIVYQVAYRARSWLQPALRIGYDARNISHGGLSLGLGLIMAW
jgi:hypothetical protein